VKLPRLRTRPGRRDQPVGANAEASQEESLREEEVLTPLEDLREEEVLTPLEGLALPGLREPQIGAQGELVDRVWLEEQHLAQSRRWLAYWLLAILSLVLILAWTATLTGWAKAEEVNDLMTIVFAPIIGLVGAATGFYFGERVGAQQRRPSQGSSNGTT
jgi:hypothetical protein